MKQLRYYLLLFVLVMASGAVSPAKAGELDDIYRLADEKKLDQAMKRLDVFLKEHPHDAQARFLQGLIFTGKSRNEDAIRVFQELGSEFPDLPEPFNNLAVLYAERGDYEKARQALVNAVRILPDYATAHENLGDVYAKLASQSYAQALRINGSNSFVSAKLDLMRKLFVLPTTPPEDVAVSTATKQVEKQAVKQTEKQPGKQAEKGTKPVDVASSEDASESVADAADGELAKPETAKAQDVETKSSGAESAGVDTEIERVMHDWAQAWSTRQVDDYLAFYSDKFQVPKKFPNRGAWEAQRRQALKSGAIRVTLSNIKVTMLGAGRARVSFMQHYRSDRYQDQVGKSVDLQKEGGVWKFVREYS